MTQKLLKGGPEVTKTVAKVTLEPLFTHFDAGTPKVTFGESLFHVFELFGVSESVGRISGHNRSRDGDCGRAKMEPFVLLACFPCFILIFVQLNILFRSNPRFPY